MSLEKDQNKKIGLAPVKIGEIVPSIILRDRNFSFDSESNSSFGATLMKLNTELGEYFKSPTKKGMLVTKIKKESSGDISIK